MANPACRDYWDAHRSIAYWIQEFTTVTRENIQALAKEQREPPKARTLEAPGTPWMQHTTDFDESELPIPASASEN